MRLRSVLEADILSTRCNKDDVMWDVRLFWETVTASYDIVYLFIFSLTLQISQGSESTYTVKWAI